MATFKTPTLDPATGRGREKHVPGYLTQAALSGAYLGKGHHDYTGSGPMVEIAILDSGASLHLIYAEGSDAPYVVGVGGDHSPPPGQTATLVTASVKADRLMGFGAGLTATSGPDSYGFFGQSFGPGKLMELRATEASGVLANLVNYGTANNMFQWTEASGKVRGRVGADNVLEVQNNADGVDPSYMRFYVAPYSTQQTNYVVTGSPNLWWASAVTATEQSLKLQSAAAAARGAEVLNTIIEIKGGNLLGFHGVAPTVRESVLAAATDLASVIALANDLREKLITKGNVAA